MPFQCQCVKLNNGKDFPILGLGTWQSNPGEFAQAVIHAIDAGYRHIDCALIYQNENEVGTALKAKMGDGTIKRENIFVTSKVWCTYHSKDAVKKGLDETLKSLGLAYLDMYLIHWPMGYKEDAGLFPKDDDDKIIPSDVDFIETWLAMEELVKEGLVRSIGVSNFNKDQIERIIEKGTIVPATNQIECHPFLNQSKLVDYCKSRGIVVTAYSPLGSPERPGAQPGEIGIMGQPKIVAIAEKYQKSSAQVLIKYQIQRGVVCIPKSANKSRIIQNFQVWDFELSSDDMTTLNSFDCNERLLKLEWVNNHKYYPFNTEF